ncbi:multi-sensor signal transduction histidine kinase [Desulfovibrio sp. X2]|uniref:ATP-binding protein n=1 Tax=Desulfovibrio sp. X2 TaxID=941449 RepID=UPI000358E88B|nr:ATP-binding protein [Desulfovibrio sp. X2]EPR39832.1 multi-sensor signal transduction histidine kinase [Desulfovibrio sp. X2]
MRTTFRSRLLLWFWALLLLAAAPLYFFIADSVKTDLLNNDRQLALHMLDGASWLLTHHEPFADDARLEDWAQQVGDRLGLRLTVIDGGHVLADSKVPWDRVPEMEDHSTRPEVVEAAHGGTGMSVRHSATLDRDLIYVARLAELPGHDHPLVVRVALPMAELTQRLDALKTRFLIILAACMGCAALLSYWATGGMATSIRELSSLVADIGRGAYGRRVRVYSGEEFAPLVEAVNRMAGDIERHVGMVEEQKGQLEALFNGLSEGVMTVDGQGRVVSVNSSFREMFPEAEHGEGKAVLEATLDAELARLVERALKPDFSGEGPRLVLTRPSGRELEARVDAYPDPSGARRAVVVVQDVSQIRKLARVRRDFVANVSHELRTPLTSIKGYAETLSAMPPENVADRDRFLGVIQRNADHMSRMVDSLLALARWENSQPGSRTVAVNARALAEEAAQNIWPAAQGKSVSVAVDAPQDLPEVMGDAGGLADVFRNLIDNAVKYSPEGGSVRVAAEARDERVVFRVEDQGPGIPGHAKDRIFERFYRVGDGPGKKDGGAGLGLAICRNIVTALGGTIWVESPLSDGKGSAFAFDLPRARTAAD